jgi:hypothetical protein
VAPSRHHRDQWSTLANSWSMCVAATLKGGGKPRMTGAAIVAAPRSLFILRERSVEERGGGGVHHLAALNVVLHRDLRVRVAEQL